LTKLNRIELKILLTKKASETEAFKNPFMQTIP